MYVTESVFSGGDYPKGGILLEGDQLATQDYEERDHLSVLVTKLCLQPTNQRAEV